jgi:hypothetical protein
MDIYLALASAVLKASLTIWLKGDAIGTGITTTVVDLIASRVTGQLNQRRVRRLFEDLEVPIAKQLESIRRSAFSGIPENEWSAAVYAAQLSFNNAELTATELFRLDLDPLTLERHIRAGNPAATRDLSERATGLYERLISDGCSFAINVADRLPQFQTNAFSELLRRDSLILDRITEVLHLIQVSSTDPDESRFVNAFLRHITTKFDRLEISGFDFEPSWQPLSIAYVSLRTADRADVGAQAVEHRILTNSRTMLVGRAGSGKTTVLQWLAVNAAKDFGQHLPATKKFPFIIRLRDYLDKDLPEPEEFLSSATPMLSSQQPVGWVRHQLESGQAHVLVDGVDELPEESRARVKLWLRDLVDLYPDARYVVTTRPTAVPDGWLADLRFTASSLEAMSPTLIREFIGKWHLAARQQASEIEAHQRIDTCEQFLLSEVAKDRYLRNLADTPLVAGLLCSLNRHLGSGLPRRRTEIFERTLVMLEERDRVRGISPGDMQLDSVAETYLLGDIALWMIRNGDAEADIDKAVGQISRSLSSLPDNSLQAMPTFRHLLERSGLLREPSLGRVDFVHKAFQEYLAAKAAINADAIGELVSNAGNDQWGDVVVFAAGQAFKPQAEDIVRNLLRRKWRGRERYRRLALAVACLREVPSLDSSLRNDVASAIPDLLPPRSMAQAEQLASAGEPLIDLLQIHWHRDVRKARECIRAASVVGGMAAMLLVREIGLKTQGLDIDLSSELERARQYFNAEEFDAHVLSFLNSDRVTVRMADDLLALPHMSSVNSLIIESFDYPTVNLDAILGLSGLKKLSIAWKSFDASTHRMFLAALARLPLTDLELFGYPFAELSQFQLMAHVRTLRLVDSDTLEDMCGIDKFPELTHLLVSGCSNLRNLGDLGVVRNLDIAEFHGTKHLNLSGLELPAGLRSLGFYECGDLDLGPFSPAHAFTIRIGGDTHLRHPEVLAVGTDVYSRSPQLEARMT